MSNNIIIDKKVIIDVKWFVRIYKFKLVLFFLSLMVGNNFKNDVWQMTHAQKSR